MVLLPSAEARFHLNSREVAEGANNPGEHFGSDIQVKRLVAEESTEHERSSRTDGGVCARVRRIGRGLTCLRKPNWIRRRVRVAVRVRRSDRAAAEVPSAAAYPPGTVDTIATPGADTATCGPAALKFAGKRSFKD